MPNRYIIDMSIQYIITLQDLELLGWNVFEMTKRRYSDVPP
jgi:hypothetical protein